MGTNLAPSLTIFQVSLHKGDVPDDWKKAQVVPINKNGDRSSPANYRLITLISMVCKALEYILLTSIYTHLDKYNILCMEQYGFCKRRSCDTQLISTIHDFATSLDSSEQVDAILLDLSKAFDKVPHI